MYVLRDPDPPVVASILSGQTSVFYDKVSNVRSQTFCFTASFYYTQRALKTAKLCGEPVGGAKQFHPPSLLLRRVSDLLRPDTSTVFAVHKTHSLRAKKP